MSVATLGIEDSQDVRNAVANVHDRFLGVVSDGIAASASRDDLLRELVTELLAHTGGSYGFLLTRIPSDLRAVDRISCPFAISIVDETREVRVDPVLTQNVPDRLVGGVIATGRAVHSSGPGLGRPACLPEGHPEIRSVALLPLPSGADARQVICLANFSGALDRAVMAEVQSIVDAIAGSGLATLVNGSMDDLINDIELSSRRLVMLTQASLNGIMVIDERGDITAFNPACEEIFGARAPDVIGTAASAFLPDSVLQPILSQAEQFQRGLNVRDGRTYRRRDIPALRDNGRDFRLDLVVYHQRVQDQVFSTLVLADISDRIESAKELQETVSQFRTLTRLAPVGIIELGADWTCVYANDMWCELSRLNIEETLNTGWIDAIHTDDVVQTLIDMRDSLGAGQTFRRELRLQSPLGATLWVSMSATGLYNEYESLVGTLIVIMDITEKHLASERLREVAHRDELTGLLNRSRFLEVLEHDLERCDPRCKVALLYIDLDGFKQVNDTYGHDHGDELLRQVATRLATIVREEDSIARLGGDEFTVTLSHVPSSQAVRTVAEKIVHELRLPFEIQHRQVYVTASVGIAIGDRDTESRDGFIKQADLALYRAKESGRSRFVFYTAAIDQEQRARSMLVSSIRGAVDRRAFELYYQPQVCIDDHRLFGMEALLRWPQAGGVTVPTERVIEVMEETGLIDDVGQWVIKEACQQFVGWRDAGLIAPETTLSVNVSASQLGMPHFVRHVDAILKRFGMPAENLILEITESTLVETIESDVLEKIKALGLKLSVDDFGTGYSSLAYLGHLPLDHLKIDRSFIADITRSPRAITVVKSIIALARTLGIEVIAEGVEDASVLPLLAAEGCASYQGFHLSMPVGASDVPRMLRALAERRPEEETAFIDLGEPADRDIDNARTLDLCDPA